MPNQEEISSAIIEHKKVSGNGTSKQANQIKDRIAEIRSDEVQEILAQVPNWMIRWGITLIFGLVLLLVFISWFIKYPDVIQGQAIITTEQPPVRLISKTNGYIEQLYFADNSAIEVGQIIAEITNPTSMEAIDHLKKMIENPTLETLIDTNLVLGEVQAEYNNFIKNLKEYGVFINDEYYQKEVISMKKQIEYNNRLAWITNGQLELMKKEIANANEKFNSDSLLYQKDVISKNEFFANQSELLVKQQQLANTKKAYVQYKITATDYEKRLNELEKQYEKQERELAANIESNKKNIQSYIENWQQNYTLTSPISGKLSFVTNITENQYVNAQSSLFAVVPDNQDFIGNIQIPTQGYGKIKKGQKVRIKLDNYPYQEYGQLMGEIKEVSLVSTKVATGESTQSVYYLTVTLPKNLITTYQKEIKYTPEMTGSAEIITEDLRLLERIFNKFRKVLDK